MGGPEDQVRCQEPQKAQAWANRGQKATPDSHSRRLVVIARQLRAAADLVERGELGNVEDAALVMTMYKAPAWAMGIGADPGEIVGRAMGQGEWQP